MWSRNILQTWGYSSGLLDPTRAGIPWRRTASRNSGQRSSGIVEQKSLARNLVNDNDAGSDIGSNSLYCWHVVLAVVDDHHKPFHDDVDGHLVSKLIYWGLGEKSWSWFRYLKTLDLDTWSPMQHSSQVSEWSWGSAQVSAHIHSAFGGSWWWCCHLLSFSWVLGKPTPSKTDEFSEKFQRGRGVIFNPKIYVAKFGPLNRAIWPWKRQLLKAS